MNRLTQSIPGKWAGVALFLGLAGTTWLAPRVSAQPADGTYTGTTSQGRTASVTVAGGQVTSWTLSYSCPGFTATTTVNVSSCPIVGNSFSCGSTFCSPFAATTRLSGTFAGTMVSGTFDVRHQLNQFSSCCSLTARTWSATLDAGGTCEAATTLTCGSSHSWSSDGAGSTENVDTYACNSWPYPGPEYTYLFQPASASEATASVTGLTDDLDLLVLQDTGSGCDPASCVADSTNVGTDDESVTWDVLAGETYHIVVDGFGGATSGYTISLSCPIFADGFESGDTSRWSGGLR